MTDESVGGVAVATVAKAGSIVESVVSEAGRAIGWLGRQAHTAPAGALCAGLWRGSIKVDEPITNETAGRHTRIVVRVEVS